MKKLQLAHSELALRQASIPDINVIDVSSPTKSRKRLDPDKLDQNVAMEMNGKVQGAHHMSLPTSQVELKSHFHSLKATQSQRDGHHAPTIAEQGKNVYHSEPANLNGSVQTPSLEFKMPDIAARLTHGDAFFFLLLSGVVRTILVNQCRPESAQ